VKLPVIVGNYRTRACVNKTVENKASLAQNGQIDNNVFILASIVCRYIDKKVFQSQKYVPLL